MFDIIMVIWIELLLFGKDDVKPFGFPSNMVHSVENVINLVIGCEEDCHPKLLVGKKTFTCNPPLYLLVTYF